MYQYILNNNNASCTLSLEIISDYTKVLSEEEMKNLLTVSVSDYNYLINARKENIDQYWKALWQKLNLLRLYCQYRAVNKKVFHVMRGHEFLFQVINRKLYHLCNEYYSTCAHAKEVCKEVARIVDVIGFKEIDLLTVPQESGWSFVHIIYLLIDQSEHLKLQGLVLRIYRLIFVD